MRKYLLVVLFGLAALACQAQAQPAPLSQSEVEAIVLKFQAAYDDTFNHRDAKGMAALLTEDVTLQNEWGDVTQGRSKIEAMVTGLMAKLPEGQTLEDKSVSAHAVTEGVIVSQGVSSRIDPKLPMQQFYFTRVLVKQGGQWLLAATQIARPSSVPKPSPPKA